MKLHTLRFTPITGHTTCTSTRIWATYSGEQSGKGTHIWLSIDGREIKKEIDKDTDGAIVFDVNGLSPNTKYEYKIGLATKDRNDPVFKNIRPLFINTLAEDGPLKIAFGSCRYALGLLNNHLFAFEERGDQTFKHIYDSRPDMVAMLGDQIYADDKWKFAADTNKKQYERRYFEVFNTYHFAKLVSHIPTYMIMDDHEYRNGFRASEKQDNLLGYRAGLRAALKHQYLHGPRPLQGISPGQPLHYSFTAKGHGIFFMDCRMDGGKEHMIGKDQFDALENFMGTEAHHTKIIISSLPIAPDIRLTREISKDRWSSFHEDRERILSLCHGKKVIFLGGDHHTTCAATMKNRYSGQIIYSLVSSPFYWPRAAKWAYASSPKGRYATSIKGSPDWDLDIGCYTRERGFGTLEINADGTGKFKMTDLFGDVLMNKDLNLSV